MPVRQKLDGPPLHRAAQADASVIDKETRRVRVSFSSEDKLVKRMSWFDDPWLERLGHSAEEVDLSRMNGGSAPVLWGHDTWDRSEMVGIVEKAELKDGKGYADIRLSGREDVASLVQDIADGIVRNVSVGYQVLERTLVKQSDTEPNEYRVTKWAPFEISFCSVPADETVGVGRSAADAPKMFRIADINEEKTMPDNVQQNPAPQANTERQEPAANVTNEQARATAAEAAAAAAASAIKAERARIADIETMCRTHEMDDAFRAELVGSDKTVEQARSAVLDKLAERTKAGQPPHVTVGKDEQDKQRDAAESWLLKRGGEKVEDAKIQGNDFRGMSLIDMARACLQARGVSVRGMTGTEIAARAISHSTSDFPIILQNVMHKTLLAAYQAIPYTWEQFCAKGNLSDFRPHYRYRMGGFGNLATVSENGTFTYGTFADAERESITAATKGKLLNMSRQMLVNDDLGAFLSQTRAMGQAAARSIEIDVFALLAANPTLNDTGALFNATAVTTAGGHANLNSSGAAPTVAGFDAVRQAMATQVDVGANDYISVRPAIWLGPVALGGTARVVNEAQYDVDVSSKYQVPNKSRGLFTSVIDTPRLTGNVWYAFADPNVEPVIEVGFLNGQQTPYTEMQQGFEVDGVTWKVRHDYGVAAVGYRGAQKVTY